MSFYSSIVLSKVSLYLWLWSCLTPPPPALEKKFGEKPSECKSSSLKIENQTPCKCARQWAEIPGTEAKNLQLYKYIYKKTSIFSSTFTTNDSEGAESGESSCCFWYFSIGFDLWEEQEQTRLCISMCHLHLRWTQMTKTERCRRMLMWLSVRESGQLLFIFSVLSNYEFSINFCLLVFVCLTALA